MSAFTGMVCSAVILSNAITTYRRVYNGPRFIRFQTLLIGTSGILLFSRDFVGLVWENERGSLARPITAVLNAYF